MFAFCLCVKRIKTLESPINHKKKCEVIISFSLSMSKGKREKKANIQNKLTRNLQLNKKWKMKKKRERGKKFKVGRHIAVGVFVWHDDRQTVSQSHHEGSDMERLVRRIWMNVELRGDFVNQFFFFCVHIAMSGSSDMWVTCNTILIALPSVECGKNFCSKKKSFIEFGNVSLKLKP